MTSTIDTLALPPEAQDLPFREARTANAFTAEPVTDDQLREVHELVKWGPTAMNSQPLRVLLVRGVRRRRRAHRGGEDQRPAAGGYFIVGVRAAGPAAGPMSGFDAEGVRREFFADTDQLPLVVVNVGHPDHSGTRPRNPRLDLAEAVSAG